MATNSLTMGRLTYIHRPRFARMAELPRAPDGQRSVARSRAIPADAVSRPRA